MEDQPIVLALFYIVFSILFVIPGWTICNKAGFPPTRALLIFFPLLGGIVFLAILAFATWPALNRGERGERPCLD